MSQLKPGILEGATVRGTSTPKETLRASTRAGARRVHLDMLRGLAALAVVVGHIRGFLLIDYGAPGATAVWLNPIYLLCGLGHQAVIAFFALSGYLVGGKALRDMLAGNWSWGPYITARLARLWTVAIPALLLTLALDLVGSAMSNSEGYRGDYYGALSSGPSPQAPADDSLPTFAANMAFLQTIASPVFGSNGPLWSLANEFWYYIVFPLLGFGAIANAGAARRIIAAFAALAIAWWLPVDLMVLGLIWCAGAGASLLATDGLRWRFVSRPIYAIAAGLLVTALVLASRKWHGIGTDLTLGVAWALLLPALAVLPHLGGIYQRAATALSEISYTLYATHFPLLTVIYFINLAPYQWPPGLEVFGLGLAMLLAALLHATILWWCFERNTHCVQVAMRKFIAVPV